MQAAARARAQAVHTWKRASLLAALKRCKMQRSAGPGMQEPQQRGKAHGGPLTGMPVVRAIRPSGNVTGMAHLLPAGS
jgi:hypothetical protein